MCRKVVKNKGYQTEYSKYTHKKCYVVKKKPWKSPKNMRIINVKTINQGKNT